MDIQITSMQAPSSDGHHALSGKVYHPVGTPRGLFHVVHGMAEHIGRYDFFMRRMAEDGYLCFGYDHLGHGHTANGASELGYIAPKNGWRHLAEDVRRFSDAVKSAYRITAPYILMGHSMGSFVVRVAAAEYVRPDKLIIMGTGGPNPASGAGLAAIGLTRAVRGGRYVSPTIDRMTFGSFNSRFSDRTQDAGDAHLWLTKDADVRRAYDADPLCNFRFTLAAMQDLVRLNRRCNRPAWYRALPAALPVLLVSGADDPVGDYGCGVRTVYDRLLEAGVDVRIKLYENCRHEILNDTCRDEVIADIERFCDR